MKKRSKNNNKLDWLIWLLILIFGLTYSFISVVKHLHFQTGLDLAIYVQSLWSYINFQLPRVTLYPTYGDLVWSDHFSPSLVLLAPVYYFFPSAITLLVSQVVLLVLGVYPIFAFAKKTLNNFFFALSLSFSYLLFFGIQFALTFDFHTASLTAAVLPWLIWFALEKKWPYFFVTFLIALGTKEDAAPLIAPLGLYLTLTRINIRWGAFIFIFSILYFVMATKYLMPFWAINSAKTFTTPGLPGRPLEYLTLLFNSPIKINTLFLSFGSFAFLPLFSGLFLILPFTHFFINFLGDPQFLGRWGIYLHYRVQLASLLTFASTLGLKNILNLMKKRWHKATIYSFSVVLLFTTVFLDYYLHLPLNTLSKKNFYENEQWMNDLRQVIEQVPKNSYLLTQNNLLPHLANRQNIDHFPRNLDRADYVLLDLRKNQPSINFWLSGNDVDDVSRRVNQLQGSGYLVPVYKRGEAVLFSVNKK